MLYINLGRRKYYYYYCFHIFPELWAQYCNYATLLAGRYTKYVYHLQLRSFVLVYRE